MVQQLGSFDERLRRFDEVRDPLDLQVVVQSRVLSIEDDRHLSSTELTVGEAVEVHPVVVLRPGPLDVVDSETPRNQPERKLGIFECGPTEAWVETDPVVGRVDEKLPLERDVARVEEAVIERRQLGDIRVRKLQHRVAAHVFHHGVWRHARRPVDVPEDRRARLGVGGVRQQMLLE